jgi:hypothetical protein
MVELRAMAVRTWAVCDVIEYNRVFFSSPPNTLSLNEEIADTL